jgi:hypothetical protein
MTNATTTLNGNQLHTALRARGGLCYAEGGIPVRTVELSSNGLSMEWVEGRAWALGTERGGIILNLVGQVGTGWYPLGNVELLCDALPSRS